MYCTFLPIAAENGVSLAEAWSKTELIIIHWVQSQLIHINGSKSKVSESLCQVARASIS